VSNKATVELTSIEYEGKMYGAGSCVVSIGGMPINGVALHADGKRHVTSSEYALEWLVGQGLPMEKAHELLTKACEELFHIREIPDEQCDRDMLSGKLMSLRLDFTILMSVASDLLAIANTRPDAPAVVLPYREQLDSIRKRWHM
jgi:hypothetical protein